MREHLILIRQSWYPGWRDRLQESRESNTTAEELLGLIKEEHQEGPVNGDEKLSGALGCLFSRESP